MRHQRTMLACAALTLLSAWPAHAENRFFTPMLTVSEEFTDNVDDTRQNKRSDYISRLQPGFTSKYEAKRMTWDLSYAFDYRYYARNQKDNDHSHLANAKGTLQLLENVLFLDLSDTYRQVSTDTLRDQTVSSVSSNQTEQNIAIASPYLQIRITPKTSLKTGYRYTDTWYSDSTSIDKQAHTAFADLQHEFTEKLSVTAGYNFTRQFTRQLDDDKHDATIGLRYTYGDKSFITATAGQSWQQFSNDYNTDYYFWNFGLTHNFSPYTLILETRRQVTEDPLAVSTREDLYSAKIDRLFERGSISLLGSYTERYDLLNNAEDQNKSSVGVAGKYEITHGLTADASVTGEYYRYHDPVEAAANEPYRLTKTARLLWQLRQQIGLSLAYTRVANLQHKDRLSGGWTTNRVIAELKMTF